MKKLVLSVVTCLLLSCSTFAADIDVSSLDYDTLAELKNKVDQEFFSRPESQPIEMEPGYYTAGVDIKPGTYYFAFVVPEGTGYSTARMHVYQDKDQYDSRPSGNYGDYLSDTVFELGANPIDVTVEEGNYIVLEHNTVWYSSSTFNPEEYYTYEVPEGTLVDKGVYGVSSEIPEGKYTVYASDADGGYIVIYYSEQAKTEKDYSQMDTKSVYPEDPVTVDLKEGYVIEILDSVVMKKAAPLSFD